MENIVKSKIRRKGIVEGYRFLAAIAIALYHFEWLYFGYPLFLEHFYIFVEFFFVLSGFFLADKMNKISMKKTYPFIYVKKTFLKLWPSFFVIYIVTFVVQVLIKSYTLEEGFLMIMRGRGELFFLQATAFAKPHFYINRVAGSYESCLIVAGFILCVWLNITRKVKINFLLFIFSICAYKYILDIYGNISQWSAVFLQYGTIGILRAFAGVSAGAFARYFIYEIIQKCQNKIKVFLLVLSNIAMLSLIFARKSINYSNVLFYILLFMVIISCATSVENNAKNAVKDKILICFGNISYEVYAIHFIICIVFKYYFPNNIYGIIITLYIIITLLSAILVKFFVNKIEKILKKIRYNMKGGKNE